MKLSSSTTTVVSMAVAFFTNIAEAVTVKSDIFGWEYELDAAAPVVTAKDDMAAISAAYRDAVSFEMVNGTMMMIDMMAKKQVATTGGELDAWARANYPGQDVLDDGALMDEMKTELNYHLDSMRSGMSMQDSLVQRRELLSARSDEGGLQKRVCVCPAVIFSCPLIGCGGACVLIFCTG